MLCFLLQIIGCFCVVLYILTDLYYRIAGKFGGGKVWRIDSFRAFGERKFGKLIDQRIGY